MRPFFWIVFIESCCLLPCNGSAAEFSVERTDQGVTITCDGKPFTEYLIKSGAKPVLWPIIGPTGKRMTRSYPLEKAEQEQEDHIHQRSLWMTYGKVNNIDFWSESPNHGNILHREFVEVSGGPTAKIVTRNDWVDANDHKICEDERTITCRADDDVRTIDFDVKIKAGDEPVVFGETKEGAFGMRLAESLRTDGKWGSPGTIVNSNGETNDAAWGKKANWVDYHGLVGGEHVGAAILNHPGSFRHPTRWHVRNYGLFAANPFGNRSFDPAAEDGTYTLPAGESLTLRYRVVLHRGDEKLGQIAEQYENYIK